MSALNHISIHGTDAATLNNKTVIREVHIPKRILATLQHIHQLDYYQQQGEILPLWPWSRQTAWHKVKAVMKAAKITGIKASCPGLRHTFGVTATRKGVQLHILQRWLGHASMDTTAIYADVSGPDDRTIMERMWDGGDTEPPTTPPYMPEHVRKVLDKVRDIPVTRLGEGGVDVMQGSVRQPCQIIYLSDVLVK